MLADSLKNAFGLNCTVDPVKLKGLPLYMTSGRKLYKVSLGEASFLLAELPESDSFGVVALNKQRVMYYEKSGMDVAFGFESLSRIQRDALTSKGIPFISIPDQIYLPFLGVMLSNNFKRKLSVSGDKMMPATQCLFLYLLYKGSKGSVIKKQAADELGLTRTSITRASEQLKEMGLISEKKTGKETEMITVDTGYALYELAREHLINPVQKTVYISGDAPKDSFVAGESALSKQSMSGKPKIGVFAMYKNSSSVQSLKETDTQWNEDPAVNIELWKYDPSLFAKNGVVDPISLAMSLSDNEDERVQGELKKFLEEYKW